MSEQETCEACGGGVRNSPWQLGPMHPADVRGARVCCACYESEPEACYARIRERRRGQVCRDMDGVPIVVGDVLFCVGSETRPLCRVTAVYGDSFDCKRDDGENLINRTPSRWRHAPPPAKASGFEVGQRVRCLRHGGIGTVLLLDNLRGRARVRIDGDGSEWHPLCELHTYSDSKAPGGSAGSTTRLPNGDVPEHERHGSPGPGVLSEHGASVPHVKGDPGACPPVLRFGPDEYPAEPSYGISRPAEAAPSSPPVNPSYEAFRAAVAEHLEPRLPKGVRVVTDARNQHRSFVMWIEAGGECLYSEVFGSPINSATASGIEKHVALALMARGARGGGR